MVDTPIILSVNFYLKINKILKYIFLLDIYINIIISKIIINKITETNSIININKNNIDSIYID